MKIVFAATPAAGHVGPVLAVARLFQARGDDVILATGTSLRSMVEAAGIRFLPLASEADIDHTRLHELFPAVFALPAGLERLRLLLEHYVVATLPAQLATLRSGISEERPDMVVTDALFIGRVALFLDPRRPPVPLVSLGHMFLSLDRPDSAPATLGLPPARDDAERAKYGALATEIDAALWNPVRADVDATLARLDLPALPCSVGEAFVLLADAYLHPTVPAFEYDFGPLPDRVRFVGAVPQAPSDRPYPDWWGDLDAGRRAVAVTQGTVSNADFGELVEPTLAALADRDDLLVLVTTGGRPVESVGRPIPKNARIAEYWDFEALLPRVDALVTNGGYGTVQQALRAGVPIVAAGRTEDKAEVGARVAWSGVGIEIPSHRPSVAELRNAVELVLADPRYRTRAQAIAADFEAIDTRAEIFGLLDDLVERNVRR